MNTLHQFLKPYFWDVDFPTLEYEKHPRFVIERLLEFGDGPALAWMMERFSRPQIVQALEKSRQLTQKSANFWALMFGIDQEKIKCLTKSFQETRRKFWPD